MIDLEIERLRRLRGSALRIRAVARALGGSRAALNDPLLNRGACAAWRIVRAATGRLRAHPYVSFQKDPGLALLLGNSIVATAAVIGASSRLRALENFEAQLKGLARELDDARALTWAADLSDAFGRSQHEIRSLVAAIECETQGVGKTRGAGKQPAMGVRSHEPRRRLAPNAPQAAARAAPAEGDWPYLAF
jgi:hypothetical protein